MSAAMAATIAVTRGSRPPRRSHRSRGVTILSPVFSWLRGGRSPTVIHRFAGGHLKRFRAAYEYLMP